MLTTQRGISALICYYGNMWPRITFSDHRLFSDSFQNNYINFVGDRYAFLKKKSLKGAVFLNVWNIQIVSADWKLPTGSGRFCNSFYIDGEHFLVAEELNNSLLFRI